MVKQIRDSELVGEIIDRGDGYFHWLQKRSGLSGPLSSMLADTEFVSVDKLDDTLMSKAKEEVRRSYAEDICESDQNIEVLLKSIRGGCCLFEVIFCLAVSLNEMFEDFDAYDGPEHFFGVLMKNTRMDKYDEEDYDMRPEEVKAYWQRCIDRILQRTYSDVGAGGLFPLKVPLNDGVSAEYPDRRKVSLWMQMNDWVDQHTDEDGEWVD